MSTSKVTNLGPRLENHEEILELDPLPRRRYRDAEHMLNAFQRLKLKAQRFGRARTRAAA